MSERDDSMKKKNRLRKYWKEKEKDEETKEREREEGDDKKHLEKICLNI